MTTILLCLNILHNGLIRMKWHSLHAPSTVNIVHHIKSQALVLELFFHYVHFIIHCQTVYNLGRNKFNESHHWRIRNVFIYSALHVLFWLCNICTLSSIFDLGIDVNENQLVMSAGILPNHIDPGVARFPLSLFLNVCDGVRERVRTFRPTSWRLHVSAWPQSGVCGVLRTLLFVWCFPDYCDLNPGPQRHSLHC